MKKIPEGRQVGDTSQRFSSELEDKDELSKVALSEALTPKVEDDAKSNRGRQPLWLKKPAPPFLTKVTL
jgi:hypothetical protein